MAFMLAWVVKHREGWQLQALAIAYALGIAYQRIYVGAHFPLDVVAGALLGILSALFVEWLFSLRKKPQTAGATPDAPQGDGQGGEVSNQL